MDPAIPISLSIGFALRMFLLAFGHKTIARPLLVGTWEGIALYRGLSASSDSQLTAYLACALRLMFDLFFTENIRTMMMILFSLVLAILFSDALGSHRSHDIQASRLTSSRRNRVSGNHTSEVHRVSNSRRLNQARLVDRPRTHHHAVNVDGQRVIRSPVVQTRNGASVGGIPVRIDHTPEFLVADVVSPHDSPPSVHTISTHPLGTLNTRYLPSIPSEPGSPCQDEVQSPAPLAMPQTLHSNLDEMAVPGGNIDQGNGDEHVVQTPLYMQVHRPPETADSPAPLSDDVSILQWLTAHKSMLDGALHPHSNLNEVAVQTEGILEDRGDQDVLQTPLDASLAVPQTPQNDIAVQTEDILEDHGDEDLLQTPLDASLAVPQTQPPSLNDIAVQTEDILEDHGDDDTYQTPLDKNVYNPPKALGSAGPSSEEADSDPLPLRYE
ncbi:hypothetical protein DFH07DRAFT_570193 [Mycena maculata]|uniref:Uncharacterized protein n=1 Tax=Mycena maculata TaxID=230809 RepID=A0AAD7K3V7_9AGAR|nr:hypothetical protein DFH07DRAFT_570193 [Mycena maculata]